MSDKKEDFTAAVAQPATKPTMPESYVRPEVWTPKDVGGTWGAMNQPTSGARSEKTLPKGEHPYQLYSLGTPNGHKCTILLEELGVEYDAYKINIMQLDQFGSDFCAINPNSKIPAMYDYSFDPPIRLFESASIVMHIAEKEGKFLPKDPHGRAECINWVMWMQGAAPYIGGGFGHFYNYAPIHIEYAIDRFSMEVKRISDVLDKHLKGKKWICGDEYTIADMVVFPWIRAPAKFYKATEFLQFEEYKEIKRWMEQMDARPAVQRGLRVNGFGSDAVIERHSPADFDVPSAP